MHPGKTGHLVLHRLQELLGHFGVASGDLLESLVHGIILPRHIFVLDHDVVLQLQVRLLCLGEEDLLLRGLGCLLLVEHLLPLKEPLVVASHLGLGRVKCCVSEVGAVLSNAELLRIHELVLAMHLAHFLNLVKVDDEAPLIRVVLLDAFAAEHGEMVRAVEVLDALIVFLAEQAVDAFLVFEVDIAQNRVTLDDLVQDVEVQRKLVDGLDLLNQLLADGAPDAEVMVQVCQTLRAEGVSAMDENARYLLADVEFVAAKVAEV